MMIQLPVDVASGQETELACGSGDVMTISPVTIADMLAGLTELPAPSSVERRDTEKLPERNGL